MAKTKEKTGAVKRAVAKVKEAGAKVLDRLKKPKEPKKAAPGWTPAKRKAWREKMVAAKAAKAAAGKPKVGKAKAAADNPPSAKRGRVAIPRWSGRKGWHGGDRRTLYHWTDRNTGQVFVTHGEPGFGEAMDVRVATKAEALGELYDPGLHGAYAPGLHPGWTVNPPKSRPAKGTKFTGRGSRTSRTGEARVMRGKLTGVVVVWRGTHWDAGLLTLPQRDRPRDPARYRYAALKIEGGRATSLESLIATIKRRHPLVKLPGVKSWHVCHVGRTMGFEWPEKASGVVRV